MISAKNSLKSPSIRDRKAAPDNKVMKRITHLDCFSGPGGICTGFKAAGIDTVLAIEIVKSCAETYQANHPEIPVINKDIRYVTEADIKSHYPGDVDIVTSGMPCETFSTAGSKSRSSYDHRQTLFEEAIRIARIVHAKMILFENVPAIQTKRVSPESKELIVDQIYEALSATGYDNFRSAELNASEFGVPQVRRRFFIIATNQPGIKLSLPEAPMKKVTVREAFTGLPMVSNFVKGRDEKIYNQGVSLGYREESSDYLSLMRNHDFWKLKPAKGVTYHFSPKHRERTIQRFKLIKPGEGLKSLFDRLSRKELEDLQKEGILPKRWYIQRNRRLESGKPSPTVTSHALDELVHPKLNRALTIREVARLQSFPDAYDFLGGPVIAPHLYKDVQDKYEQIGDAVPPLLAYHWALVIKRILSNES